MLPSFDSSSCFGLSVARLGGRTVSGPVFTFFLQLPFFFSRLIAGSGFFSLQLLTGLSSFVGSLLVAALIRFVSFCSVLSAIARMMLSMSKTSLCFWACPLRLRPPALSSWQPWPCPSSVSPPSKPRGWQKGCLVQFLIFFTIGRVVIDASTKSLPILRPIDKKKFAAFVFKSPTSCSCAALVSALVISKCLGSLLRSPTRWGWSLMALAPYPMCARPLA